MAENVLKLKKRAVELGMSKDDAKKASRPVLEAFIAGASKSDSDDGEKPSKKKVSKKKAVAKKKSSGENTESKAASKKKSSKKSSKPKAEKPERKKTGRKPGRKPKAENNGSGRLSIGTLDWNATSEDWKPRKGGPVEALFKALKKAKGDVDKAFDAIKGDMYDFVGRTKRNGERRTKQEAEAMLRYRLNRTKFEFAVRTGQHEVATERVQYGTGSYAAQKRKPERKQNRKATSAKKAGTKTGKKRGRPKGSKNKTK